MTDYTVTLHDSITTVNRNQWNVVIEQSDLGSAFHRYEWQLAIEEAMEYTPLHVIVRKGGNPIGLFPNFVTDIDIPSMEDVMSHLPVENIPAPLYTTAKVLSDRDLPLKEMVSFSPGFGGPIVVTDESLCIDRMLGQISEQCGRPIIAHRIKAKELGYVRYGKELAKRGYTPILLDCRFELNLSYDFEDILAQMESGRRKALRDARDTDYDVVELEFDTVVPSTYERYVTDVERAGGTPHSRAFFEQLGQTFADRLKVFSVKVDGIEAGRYVYVLDDEQSTIHHFYSAIGDESNFEYSPTELLHGHAIEWGQENGYEYYDFGSTGSTFLDGTFSYKERYGGRTIPTLQWTKGYAPLLWTGYKIGQRGYQHLTYGDQ